MYEVNSMLIFFQEVMYGAVVSNQDPGMRDGHSHPRTYLSSSSLIKSLAITIISSIIIIIASIIMYGDIVLT